MNTIHLYMVSKKSLLLISGVSVLQFLVFPGEFCGHCADWLQPEEAGPQVGRVVQETVWTHLWSISWDRGQWTPQCHLSIHSPAPWLHSARTPQECTQVGGQLIFNSREAIAAIIGDIVVFLQSKNWIVLVLCLFQFKEFELYWGAVFFLWSVLTFSWFLKSNWSSDFGHAETGNGAKKRVVLRREFFSL